MQYERKSVLSDGKCEVSQNILLQIIVTFAVQINVVVVVEDNSWCWFSAISGDGQHDCEASFHCAAGLHGNCHCCH